MKKLAGILLATAVLLVGTVVLIAQNPAQGRGGAQAPPQPMSFFVTSVGKGDGANYGGLAGADAYCQSLAMAAGRGSSTWHAYLSTQGPNAVNARDRIGTGPWYNANGQQFSLTEKKTVVNGVGDMPNQHDILTGSTADGRAYTDSADHTCSNYTSNANVEPPARGAPPTPGPSVQLGHSDKQGGGNSSWNSTHASRGCSQPNLVSTGGAGLLYCFATN